jgi:hypothetical protein
MANRLTDSFRVGERVEIRFADDPERRWWPGRVIRPAAPGLWVATEDGRQWFVTNSRRIRPRSGQDS